MTTAIAHVFTSTKADGPDATLVQPGDWNANHNPFLSMTNRSGAAVVQYDACAVGTANDDSFTTTTTQYDTRPLVVVAPAAGIASATAGTVQNLFQTVVNVQGSVTRGNWLRFSATAGRLEDAGLAGTVAAPHGANAIAVTGFAGPGAGTVTATLRGATAAVLPGGTTGTSGGVPYFNATTTVASSALLTANAVLLGGGAGAAPTAMGSLGTTTTVLHGNASGAPTFASVDHTADVTNVGTNTHAQIDTHIAASAAIHGLPASVNVLGNRAAAGEFVQRGTVDPGATSGANADVFIVSAGVTFAVAFSSTPFVASAGTTHSSATNIVFFSVQSITTTGCNIITFAFAASVDIADARYIALGA